MITANNQFEHFISFRSTGIMAYSVALNHRQRLSTSSLFNQNAAKLAKRERYVGFITPAIKKRMKRCITLLLQSTPNTWKEHPVTGKMVNINYHLSRSRRQILKSHEMQLFVISIYCNRC